MIQLLESGNNARHHAAGLPSVLSVCTHAALALAAIFATTRSDQVRNEDTPQSRVYFAPEPPTARAAGPSDTHRASAVEPEPRQVPAPTAAVGPLPVGLPPVDVPLSAPGAPEPVVAPPPGGDVPTPGATPSPGETGRPYDARTVEVAAVLLSNSGPDYPESAIRKSLSGSVTAQFVVGERGRVEDGVVILDSTPTEFSSSVRAFLRHARFRPALVGGRPVRQLVEQRFVFELRK